MARAIAAALLLLLASHHAAAWKEPNCKDVIVGESNTLGVVGENKPMQKVDHTEQWRQHGQITKLNLYYSWNYGCLQGIKATYGYKAGNALIVGHEKNLYTQDIKLADYEHVVKADWRQQPNKCIEYIKLYTNKGNHLTFGNSKSTSLFQTVAAPVGGWLAALKGEHDLETASGKQVAGGLQNLVFVWAKEECSAETPSTPPAGAVPKPTPPAAEAPTPVEGPEQPENPSVPPATPTNQPGAPAPANPETPVAPPTEPEQPPVTPSTPTVPDSPEGPEPLPPVPVIPVIPAAPPVAPPVGVPVDVSTVCPPVPSMCSEEGSEGSIEFCPVVSPFSKARCEGGCCFSSGKCKLPLCKLNGLGADVMALDFICYGKNNGPFGGLNKCRNLACRLAVPGCQSSLLGGNCVGTVVAANDNLDDMAKQYIGKPCIEVVNHPGPLIHMPLNKPGLPVPNGEYMGSLWTVCDCYAQPTPVLPAVPVFDLNKHLLGKMHPFFAALVAGVGDDSCHGPLCALLPQLPVLNASLPEIQIPMTLLANLTAMLKPHPLPDVAPLAGLIPAIKLPEIQVRLSPLTLPDLPTFEECADYFVNVTAALKPAIEAVLPSPQLSIPDLVHIVSGLLPQIKHELPQLELTAVPKIALPDLVGLVKAVLPKMPQFPQIAVNFPHLRLPGKTNVTLDVSSSTSHS